VEQVRHLIVEQKTCTTSCIFNKVVNGTNQIYNLSSLSGNTWTIDNIQGSTIINSFRISLCNKAFDCSLVKSFVCSLSAEGSQDFGSRLTFDPDMQNTIDGFKLIYDSADSQPTAACPNSRKSIIRFDCDTDFEGTPALLSTDGCTATFSWKSYIGCRVCNMSDYEKSETTCKNGFNYVSYVRKSSCNGDVLLNIETTKCETKYSLTWVWVLAIFGVFVLLLAALAIVLYRCLYLQSEVRYARLATSKHAQNFEINSETDNM